MPLLQRSRVMDYYKTWYTPANAILVVSGDAAFKDVLEQAKTHTALFHPINFPNIFPRAPDFNSSIRLTFHHNDVRQPICIKHGWYRPFAKTSRPILTFEVLNRNAFGWCCNKIISNLVVDRKRQHQSACHMMAMHATRAFDVVLRDTRPTVSTWTIWKRKRYCISRSGRQRH